MLGYQYVEILMIKNEIKASKKSYSKKRFRKARKNWQNKNSKNMLTISDKDVKIQHVADKKRLNQTVKKLVKK